MNIDEFFTKCDAAMDEFCQQEDRNNTIEKILQAQRQGADMTSNNFVDMFERCFWPWLDSIGLEIRPKQTGDCFPRDGKARQPARGGGPLSNMEFSPSNDGDLQAANGVKAESPIVKIGVSEEFERKIYGH